MTLSEYSSEPSARQSRLGRPPMSDDLKREWLELELLTNFIIDENGCWLWQGSIWDNGYGRIARYRKLPDTSERAHIFSYLYHRGSILQGKLVCHTCDVNSCINPDHLWLGTNRDNQLDAVKKGSFTRYWTPARRRACSKKYSGKGNPMFGRTGKAAPAFGRVGALHPMFGKHHSQKAKNKISMSLKRTFSRRTRQPRVERDGH